MTFVCPLGEFCFTRMPFELGNGPAVFQQLMDKALDGCQEFSKTDVFIFSWSWAGTSVAYILALG